MKDQKAHIKITNKSIIKNTENPSEGLVKPLKKKTKVITTPIEYTNTMWYSTIAVKNISVKCEVVTTSNKQLIKQIKIAC